MERERLWAIAYDISSDKNRQKVCDILKDFGFHVQYSLFECRLSPEALDGVLRLILPYFDESTDSLRVYPLCESCSRKRLGFGRALQQRARTMVV